MVKADVTTIDSLSVEDVRFIKIDVEGAECDAFDGARDTISETWPVIVFEHRLRLIEMSGRSPLEYLRSLGYW